MNSNEGTFMDGIKEVEKYFCEYIFLGLPEKPLRYFLKFRLKKGFVPTLYGEKLPFWVKFLELVDFTKAYGLERDGIALELLKRHAAFCGAKRITLIPSRTFEGFVTRNTEELERLFLIKKSEDVYTI